jgi:cbb3-type cytochrome oxidase maturation protein
MSVIIVLLGFSLLVAGGFLIAFLVAVRSGQFDDRETPSIRMLFDDRPKQPQTPPSSTQPDSHGERTL